MSYNQPLGSSEILKKTENVFMALYALLLFASVLLYNYSIIISSILGILGSYFMSCHIKWTIQAIKNRKNKNK